MNIDEYKFILEDRIAKIKAINEQYDLENNAYISFSGGKDSTVLHYLMDLVLPNNHIPRVYLNTGIEYGDIRKYVQKLAKNDSRFKIVNSNINIKNMLEKYGYPFKSKEYSHLVHIYQNSGKSLSVKKFLGEKEGNRVIHCPKKLKYQFREDFNIKISDKCCYKLKKEPAKKWAKENGKSIILTGMRTGEGGQRLSATCIVTDKNFNLVKFHPLLVVDSEWEEEFIKQNKITLCKLYYEPYNFNRTGCKGCPFALNLEAELNKLKELLPNEYKQCNLLWGKIYDEYKRIGFRLKPKQLSIFDME